MRRYWSEAAKVKLRRLYPTTPMERLCFIFKRTDPAVQQMALKLGLKKDAAFVAKHARFQHGHATWNLGKTGYMGANRTSFPKGHMPHNWHPIGHERLTDDGTLMRKVKDTRRKSDWKPVKDIIWEAKHGPIPKGRFVVHKNRDRQDFRLRNLALVDRAANMERNSYHNRYPKEMGITYLTT